MKRLIALLAVLAPLPLAAQMTAPLPPLPPWSGKTKALIVDSSDKWVTPAERTKLTATPTYDETFNWLRKLVAAAPQLKLVSIGKSAEGRDLWMVIASKERAFTPDAMRRSGKPVVFVQAGIHSGEIDGKDAGMMLLRDMTVRGSKRALLDGANLLFVPIFNVDGHERASNFSRINQRGPEIQGWRTNARNFNLNRDYVKADTEEMQALVRALDTWKPDLYVDVHVTDGADYQYDITYGWNGPHVWSPASAAWLDKHFRPEVDAALSRAGHVPGKLVFGVAGDNLFAGIVEWASAPRFSTGYGDARHIPSILVENHSLKPYDQRVLGTYIFLEQMLETVATHGRQLRDAVIADQKRNAPTIPLDFKIPDSPPETIEFLGLESQTTLSPISGTTRTEWTGKPVTINIPYFKTTEVKTTVSRPKAYWVPASWRDVIAKLDVHGIRYERLAAPREIELEMLRLSDVTYDAAAFEGHVRVTAKTTPETRRERFPAGSVRVPADQPLGTLAAIMLEPSSPDSLFQWGWFHSILRPSEYAEAYVLEPMAAEMMKQDPKLAEKFRTKIEKDAEFRGSSQKRLDWFYRKTAYFEERSLLYPVGIER